LKGLLKVLVKEIKEHISEQALCGAERNKTALWSLTRKREPPELIRKGTFRAADCSPSIPTMKLHLLLL